MKIHEHQAKEILKSYNVAVPEGEVLFSAGDIDKAVDKLGLPVVIKAQIHAGGRGKGGGVKLAKSREDALRIAGKILGMTLITHQTGSEGKVVKRLLVEQGINIDRELYAGIVMDRERAQNVIMVSTEGGVEIEKVAAETPEKIIREYVDPSVGLQGYQVRRLCFALGLKGDQFKNGMRFISSLYKAFTGCDASLAEINPLVVTKEGDVLALDAKMNFDDNALFRHPEFAELRDLNEEEESEIEASKYNLNYIKLDGNVGCMVNGAGLAMATMDIIKLSGGEPANFLDVGGVASSETVANGFRIILSDPSVKSILINIFGGIVRCDRVAQGVIDAIGQVDVEVPVVIRLEGTNAEEAATLLKNSSLSFIVATDFKDAAVKAVQAATERGTS